MPAAQLTLSLNLLLASLCTTSVSMQSFPHSGFHGVLEAYRIFFFGAKRHSLSSFLQLDQGPDPSKTTSHLTFLTRQGRQAVEARLFQARLWPAPFVGGFCCSLKFVPRGCRSSSSCGSKPIRWQRSRNFGVLG